MEPIEPDKGLGAIVENDEVHQTEITVGHAIELADGRAISHAVRDRRIVIEEDGPSVRGDSAVPVAEA